MNFDFLKEVGELKYIYENCNNAERLAVTMPVQSVFTSRKSAELLAKFIYLAAHNQEMEGMTFSDILSDPAFRRFVDNRDMIDAFHYIRKTGNRAVHSDDEETTEDAIDVLHDLHFVAGETACMLGLIKDYPSFEENIERYPEGKFVDIDDIDQKAREMFLSYVEEFNAQQEKDAYIEQKDYDWFSYSVQGNVEMHEYLEMGHKPRPDLTEDIQNYLLTLVRLSVERSPEKAEEKELAYPVTLNAIITIGGISYSSKDPEHFAEAIIHELPGADGYMVDCYCNGVLREFFNDEQDENDNGRINMIRKDAAWTGVGLLDILEGYKRRCSFTYKLAIFYPDSGEFKYEKILNGKDIDVLALGTEEIINREFMEEWYSYNLDLWAEFDYDKHHDKLLELQEIVRTSIPASEIKYCVRGWEDGDLHILCNSIQWNCQKLSEVQAFLDRLNEVLLPIKDEIDAGGMGTWEIKPEFAVATWDWTEEGFKITGCCY